MDIDDSSQERIDFSLDILGQNPGTRLSTGPNFKSIFTSGDQIGVYIVENGQSLTSTGNWADNICVTYNGSNWTNNLSGSQQYYPNDGTTLDFYAYYPYDPAMSDPTSYTFKVQQNQSTDVNFQKSDLLISKIQNVVKSKNAVKLTFKHALSLVQMETKNNAVKDLDVIMNQFYPEITINLEDQSTSLSGSPINIQMLKTSGQTYYRALVPPQTWSKTNINLFTVNQGSDAYIYNHKQDIPFTAGDVWRIEVQGIPNN